MKIEDGRALVKLIVACKDLVKTTGVSVKKLEKDIESLSTLFAD